MKTKNVALNFIGGTSMIISFKEWKMILDSFKKGENGNMQSFWHSNGDFVGTINLDNITCVVPFGEVKSEETNKNFN